MSEWIWVSCCQIKITTVTNACVLLVKRVVWRVCSTFYDQKIDYKNETNTHCTYSIFMTHKFHSGDWDPVVHVSASLLNS